MVKRYSYSVEDGGMREQPQEWRGGWIHFADYEAVASESEGWHQSCLVLMKSVQDHRERIRQLEVALRSVRTILQSDSIEYDDMRHIDHIIDEALTGSPSRDPNLSSGSALSDVAESDADSKS